MEHSEAKSDDPPSGGSSPFPAVTGVLPWLERSRALGFLGPGPVAPHIEHAVGFAKAVGDVPEAFIDVGSGGGLPGLVLACLWDAAEVVLLDSHERRTAFLAEVVAELGWQERIRVVRARAEEAGREVHLRGRFPLAVSRSFGPPPVTAECAAPFLAVGGRLVVSEPPDGAGQGAEVLRWPSQAVAALGLAVSDRVTSSVGTYQVLSQVTPCPDRYPRRVGIPTKRPLW